MNQIYQIGSRLDHFEDRSRTGLGTYMVWLLTRCQREVANRTLVLHRVLDGNLKFLALGMMEPHQLARPVGIPYAGSSRGVIA